MTPQLYKSNWTLEDGLSVLRNIHAPLASAGFGIALGGSLLYRGHSKKDIDVIIFPMRKGAVKVDAAFVVLEFLGWTRWFSVETVQARWRKIGSADTKHVEVWKTPDGRRADLIILECGL